MDLSVCEGMGNLHRYSPSAEQWLRILIGQMDGVLLSKREKKKRTGKMSEKVRVDIIFVFSVFF